MVECLALLRLPVQSLVAWLGRGGVDLLVPATEVSPRRHDLVLLQVGHDGVTSLAGAIVAVALERRADASPQAPALDHRQPALLAQGVALVHEPPRAIADAIAALLCSFRLCMI